jgi:putative hydrolase of the HAD superfamily
MMPPDIKAVLFDVDDTLFDREAAQRITLEQIVKQLPEALGKYAMSRLMEVWLESDRFASADFVASPPSQTLRDTRSRKFLQLLGLGEELVETVTRTYLKEYPLVNTPVAGAIPLVKNLSLRFKTGVVSNSLPDVQYRKLETLGLRDIFSCIVLSEEIGIRKPDPRIFRHAAGLLGVPPEKCLYIGDSFCADVIGARSAGMQACWYRQGKPAPPDQSVKADYTVDALSEIEMLLK